MSRQLVPVMARISDVGSVDYATRGVVVPEMDPRLYLVLLLVLTALALAPSGLRSAWRKLAGG